MMDFSLVVIAIGLAVLLGLLAYFFGKSEAKEAKTNETISKVAQANAGLSDDVVISKLRKHNSKQKIVPLPDR